jgi:hypothetical protein
VTPAVRVEKRKRRRLGLFIVIPGVKNERRGAKARRSDAEKRGVRGG